MTSAALIFLTDGPPIGQFSNLHVKRRCPESAVVLPHSEDIVGPVGQGLSVLRPVGAVAHMFGVARRSDKEKCGYP